LRSTRFRRSASIRNAAIIDIFLRSDIRARRVLGVPPLLLAARLIWSSLEPLDVHTVDWGFCLAIVGLVLLGERRYLAVDTRSGLLLSKRGIFYPFTTASFVAADVKYIGFMSYSGRSSSASTTINRYKLVDNGRPDGTLADLGDRWQARRAGERLCTALNVPFDNRIYGPHSVRPPDELDTPLAERWRHAGEVHERPSLPADSALVVEEIGPNVVVSLPAQTYSLKWIALLASCFAAVGVQMYSTGPTGAAPWFLHFFLAWQRQRPGRYLFTATVIQSLVQGIDPETGDELPKKNIVNRIEANRALSTGILALDQAGVRLVRKERATVD
jgi:hypothetical protein